MDINSQYVYNAPAASAADITLAGSLLSMTLNDAGLKRVFDYGLIKRGSFTKTVAVAEVLQVSTVTYTYAANTVFSFQVSQLINGSTKSAVISVDTTSPGIRTDALVATYIKSQVTALGFKITPSGSASPVTLTAQAGFAKFEIKAISNVTIATTTAGVNPVGTYAALLLEGVPGITVGASYTCYEFIVASSDGQMYGKESSLGEEKIKWYLNEAGTNTAALITRFDRWIAGTDNAGTAVNQEGFSIT